MLSSNFKNTHNASGYGPYVDWWDTVERVDILSIEIQEQHGDTAVVGTSLRVTYKSGRVVDDHNTFQLIRMDWEYDWLIET